MYVMLMFHVVVESTWDCKTTCFCQKFNRLNILKYIKVCGYSDLFCKILKQRSLTPRWPLTPHLLRSHVWLYPRIIVSKCHENTLKYVDTVTLFAKTWTKGQWPLDDLWPHICWGLMCDSTQGSLCPSPMKIHQSMWIQWPFFAKKKLEPKVIDP